MKPQPPIPHVPSPQTPLVAIVGRPNVGKSTLFNKLVRRRLAIVENVPGVTRDRQYATVEWNGRAFTVIDTGGFVPGEGDSLLKAVRQQAQLAVEECDVTLFVVDGREGVSAADQELAKLLRKSGKTICLVANKMDTAAQEDAASLDDFFRLGLGEVSTLSAEHGRGVEALVDRVIEALPPPSDPEDVPPEDADVPRLAIIGRPNVGKSTLVNALLGEERLVASPTPGTTRDPIDSRVSFQGKPFLLTDTAGIRRKKTIAQRVEQFAVVAALKAVERSDVAVLLLDATEPGVDQDAKLAGIAEEKGRGLIIVVNKWDKIVGAQKQEALRSELKYQLDFVAYAPILFTSALKGTHVQKVLEVASELHGQYRFRAPTPALNRLLTKIREGAAPPIVDGRPLRLYYLAQVSDSPPTFAALCNQPNGVPPRFKRMLVNQIRETFGLRVPIRLYFRERPGKAKREARKKPHLLKKRGRSRAR